MTDRQDRAATQGALTDALRACAAGKADGIDTILRLEGGRMLGVARRILGRSDLAEEALQDAMVQVWRKAGQFRAEDGSALGWLHSVLRNRCLTLLRDGRRLTTLAPADLAALQEARQEVVDDDNWQMLPGSSRLRDCLERLEPAARRAILLAHVAGYTQGEIAGMQNTPLGTVKSWIHRGLASLRECLT